jgi:hypothetical protein
LKFKLVLLLLLLLLLGFDTKVNIPAMGKKSIKEVLERFLSSFNGMLSIH